MGFLTGLSARTWAGIGLAALIAVLGWRSYVAIYDRGVADNERKHQARMAKAVELEKTEARKIALRDAKAIAYGAEEREQIRVVYRYREKEIVKHVPIDCNQCRFPPAGLGLLNDALADRKPTTPDTGSQPPDSPTPQSPGGDRSTGGNGGLVDNRQWKIL